MRWSDFTDFRAFVQRIQELERTYTDRLFHQLYSNAGNLQAWYNEPNKVPETWVGKMSTSPRDEATSWGQVGEIVLVGLINRCFPEWFPIGLPIGSETRLSSEDAVIHIDVKSHKEGDADLDRTQDVRPEQISGEGDYLRKYKHLPSQNSYVKDLSGDLGSVPPKLPPYYDFGENVLKICLTFFIICVYKLEAESSHQYLTRIQLLTVPNGLVRAVYDYRDIFQAGKDGRTSHRFRVNLRRLADHESWRWRELRYEPHGVVVTR
jgi:hypothetical protein